MPGSRGTHAPFAIRFQIQQGLDTAIPKLDWHFDAFLAHLIKRRLIVICFVNVQVPVVESLVLVAQAVFHDSQKPAQLLMSPAPLSVRKLELFPVLAETS